MNYEHFKISDTDGTVLDISDIMKIELRSDNVQTFDTKWDDTIVMQKQPDEELLDNLYTRQLETSDQIRQLVAMYIQDTVQTSAPKSYTKLKSMVTRRLEQKTRETFLYS